MAGAAEQCSWRSLLSLSAAICHRALAPAPRSTKAARQCQHKGQAAGRLCEGVLHFWERAASLRHRLDAAAGISASQMPGYNLKRGSISITNPIFPCGFIPQLFSSTLGWTFFTFFPAQHLNPAQPLLVVRWRRKLHMHTNTHEHTQKAYTNICPQRDLSQKTRPANANKLNF